MTGQSITKIYVAGEAAKQFRLMLDQAGMSKTSVVGSNRKELDSMTRSNAHQGVAAKIGEIEYNSLEDILDVASKGGLIILLDRIQDPRNLGAIARTANAVGAAGIVISEKHSAPVTASALKASAGAFFHIKTAYLTNISRAMDSVKQAGFWIYGADSKAGENLYGVEFADKTALVFGGEEKGLRPLVRSKCDAIFKIPMGEGAESLNVSVAAAVAMYEILHGRKKRPVPP